MRAFAFAVACILLTLTGCQSWPLHPVDYRTPILSPSRTPSIRTPTPFIATPTVGTLSVLTLTVPAATPGTSTVEASPTPTAIPTGTVPTGAIQVKILGCDTSIDLAHEMGEVTNAYVTISNSTGTDTDELCATLRGLDEGRPHPDKTKCSPPIPSGYQVTLKLTVDTTFQESTPIQVDLTSGATLIVRAGEAACTDIGLLAPPPGDLGTLKPIP